MSAKRVHINVITMLLVPTTLDLTHVLVILVTVVTAIPVTTLMSAMRVHTLVIRTLHVLIQMDHSHVLVILATKVSNDH